MHIQTVDKSTGPVTPNLNFKVMIFFSAKYLENGKKYSYIYNGN